MLSATRSGQLEDWHVQEFFKLSRVVEYSDGISPTQLYVSSIPRSVWCIISHCRLQVSTKEPGGVVQ